MPSKKILLRKARFYLILDREVCGYEQLFEILMQGLKYGVDIVQLRDKYGKAADILKFSKEAVQGIQGRMPFILNDRVDLALAGGASGVHLGQEDMPIPIARRIMGKNFLIGASCQTLEQVRRAEREGADYIGFGSVFKTLTKPDRRPMDLQLLERVLKEIKIPVFAIGGINVRNVATLRARGVERIAVCRDICLASHVPEAIKSLRRSLGL